MKRPNRLLDEGANGFERQLLSAALTERPTAEAQTRLLVSLGVAGAATTAAAEGARAAGSIATAMKAWALKSLCVVAIAVTAGAATVRVVRSSAHVPVAEGSSATASRAASPSAIASATIPVGGGEATPAAIASSAPAPLVSSVVGPNPIASKPAPRLLPPTTTRHVPTGSSAARSPEALPPNAPPRAASRASLAEETAALDEARLALRAGRAAEAMVSLDAFERLFPNGPLRSEASAIRVEALLALGDRPGAETVARALVATAPMTFAAHRVKTLLNW
jgi:hypothetical protein